MGQPTCLREGCKKPLAAAYLCRDHFKDEHGITVDEYRANKRHRGESASRVAARLKGEKPVAKKEKHPAKPPTPPVTGIPTTEQQEPTNRWFGSLSWSDSKGWHVEAAPRCGRKS